MADVCKACRRDNCHCPICNGTGRSRGRGYTTECHHCVSVLVSNLDDRILALESELAEMRKREEQLDVRRREGRGLLRRGMAQCFAVLRKGDMTRLSVWCTQVDDYLSRTSEPRDILRSPRPEPERRDEEK